MKLFRRLLAVCLIPLCAAAQEIHPDSLSTQPLPEITVHGFEQDASLSKTPAAINRIDSALLGSFDHTGIVSAVNATPGVRMEERSPGSYRLAIRGSSLRSPFGVRNVKIYYNGIPFTDPGGTTYLNQLGYYNFSSIEILKGPGSSLYGAGTGGVMLISSEPAHWSQGAKAEVTGGSYGLLNAAGEVRFGQEGTHNTIRYQHLASDGYRDQTSLQRDVVSWDAVSAVNTTTRLDAHFLYGHLTYETPGALTLQEWDSMPRMARPQTGTTPGAAEAHALIDQETVLAGFTASHAFDNHWQSTTTLYGVYSQVRNPNIRNYSQTAEPNFGGRSVWKYSRERGSILIQWLAGAEFQQNFSTVVTYGNNGGIRDTLQTDESIQSRQLTGFTQLALSFGGGWVLTAGASVSQLRLSYDLRSVPGYPSQVRDFGEELSPRLALLKQWNQGVSVYGVVARGFSPPTAAELVPSGSNANLSLAPEYGWNYEAGARGLLLNGRLQYDLSLYYFALSHTIVQRRDAAGGDYYTNSGNTRQAGAELGLNCILLQKNTNSFGEASLRASYTYQHFRYGRFQQLDKDYSGNRLPGVPPHTIAAGLSLRSRFGVYLNVNYYYNDALPLNDANTDWNPAYHLLGARLGYGFALKKLGLELFGGGENLTDARYSAGPDINAFGGRYYNTSPGRSFYAGLALRYDR